MTFEQVVSRIEGLEDRVKELEDAWPVSKEKPAGKTGETKEPRKDR